MSFIIGVTLSAIAFVLFVFLCAWFHKPKKKPPMPELTFHRYIIIGLIAFNAVSISTLSGLLKKEQMASEKDIHKLTQLYQTHKEHTHIYNSVPK